MLTRLTPDQISEYWPMIEHAIESALPPTTGESAGKMQNILVSLLSGGMECWASLTVDSETGTSINGIVVTAIMIDGNCGTRDLLIYAVYGIDELLRSSWNDGYETLSKWAKKNKCNRLTAYSSLPGVAALARRLGGTADQRYIIVPLNPSADN